VTFPTSTPSTQGIDPAGLHAFLDALDTDPVIEPHGLIIQRHGRRVLEGYWRPHTAEQIRLVYSLSKSFTGTALGLAIGDGLVDLDDLVGDHLPELTADASARTLEMRVRHLASMSTGHADETLLDAFIANPTDPLAGFFTVEPQHDPGTWFAYNQPPVLALSALLQHATGRRMNDLLRERVLDPIGIRDLRWYQHRPEVDLGFSGVFTNLDAIARLGQLYLDDGMWDGEQVLPQGWVALASSTQTDNSHRPEPDWSRGYGFQFWMCRHGYRGDGAFGQYMVILPEHDTVVAFFSHTEPMQSFMDLIWDVLLPALGPTDESLASADHDVGSALALALGPDGDAAIAQRTASLALATAAQRTGWGNPLDRAVAGRFERSDSGADHPSITSIDVELDLDVDRSCTGSASVGTLVVHEGDHSIRVPLSSGWTEVDGHPIATSAAVHDDGSISVDLMITASPHRLEIRTDATSSTFSATWPITPLFGMGLDSVLAKIAPPD